MNDTYEDYLEFLNGNIERIRNSLLIHEGSQEREIYLAPFRENFIEKVQSEYTPGLVSATDSSEFVRELYNGKKIILIRAYAKTRNLAAKEFICEVMDVNRDEIRNFTILLMEHTEHLATMKLLAKEKPEFVLMDGSLVGRLMHKRHRIDAENYEDFIDEYIKSLNTLLRFCIDNRIPMVFIAKSSESRMYRDYLLGTLDRSRYPEDFIKSEMDHKRTDHLIVKSLAETTGFTTPLKASFDMDRSSFGDSRISVVTFHAMPDLNDLPIKVDLVLPEAQEKHIDKPEPFEVREEILNMVFWGYGGLKTHNIWLADVDREVKFRQKEIEGLYMRTFERMTGVAFYETRGERRARIRI